MGEIVDEEQFSDTFLWEQWAGEEARWYEAFFTWYLLMGPTRSILGAFRRYKDSEAEEDGVPYDHSRPGLSRYWYVKAKKFDWEARADAWDAHNRQIEWEKWEKRRKELRESEWVASEQLLTTANEHLSKREQVSLPTSHPDDGKSGRVQMRSKAPLKPGDVVRYIEVGSKVGRAATDLGEDPTINIKVSVELDEIRKQRWKEVAPNLHKLLDDGIEDEAASVPPMDGVVESDADSE